uniref:Uncharacterized protein n=1 Tax=Arundo donax TaxID=35708 RepID=A0A0A9F906_ARUDO
MLVLGKYCTGTDGVVELRNLSRFPASSTAAGGGATPTSTVAVAFAADDADTDGLDGTDVRAPASVHLSTSLVGAAVSAVPGGGGGFCLAALGVSAEAGDDGRCPWAIPLSRICCSSCCWRRTWGGL